MEEMRASSEKAKEDGKDRQTRVKNIQPSSGEERRYGPGRIIRRFKTKGMRHRIAENDNHTLP